jgi:hypothetical protein
MIGMIKGGIDKMNNGRVRLKSVGKQALDHFRQFQAMARSAVHENTFDDIRVSLKIAFWLDFGVALKF